VISAILNSSAKLGSKIYLTTFLLRRDKSRLETPATRNNPLIPSKARVVSAVPDAGGCGTAVGMAVGRRVGDGGTQVTPGAVVPSQIGPKVGAWAEVGLYATVRRQITIKKTVRILICILCILYIYCD